VAQGGSLAQDLREEERSERKNLSRLWVKRQVCLREWGHEGFHSKGGSWEEGSIRKDKEGCQNASQRNASDCSAMTLRDFGQILELKGPEKELSICLALVSSKEHKALGTLTISLLRV